MKCEAVLRAPLGRDGVNQRHQSDGFARRMRRGMRGTGQLRNREHRGQSQTHGQYEHESRASDQPGVYTAGDVEYMYRIS